LKKVNIKNDKFAVIGVRAVIVGVFLSKQTHTTVRVCTN